jgi:hypothetical protein
VRWAVLLVSLSACAPDFEPNPIFVADDWADIGCEQHGGTCGGGFFGACFDDSWRMDNSLTCGTDNYFEVSCCFPTDAGPDAAVMFDAGAPPADAAEVGVDAGVISDARSDADVGNDGHSADTSGSDAGVE